MTYYIGAASTFISPQERMRLVYLCATITGNSDVAEDLAQETLLEAWRHIEGLRDPEKRSQWLSGIARNVCRRWNRQRGRDLAHTTPLLAADEQEELIAEEALADTFDLEIELERKELIDLLDRAMGELPLETRTALVKHYIDESPLAEIAAQLDTNTSAIAMRLMRGKLALRRVLTTSMKNDLLPYRYYTAEQRTWEKTSLWCEVCGQQRLIGYLDPEQGLIVLKCPTCCHDTGMIYRQTLFPELLKGVKSYKRATSRIEAWARKYYRAGIDAGSTPCVNCGKPTRMLRIQPGNEYTWREAGELLRLYESDQRHGISFFCSSCNYQCITLSNGFVSWLPETRQFLREHPRIHTHPERQLEFAGIPAILTRVSSVTDSASLDVILALDTYKALHISRG